MPGPTVNWKKLDTGAWRSEIVEGGRYQLASPSAVTGNPSLAMQAGQSCTVRVYIGGTLYPDASLTVNGTTSVAILNAVGQPLTGQEKFDLVIEVAMPYGQNLLTTDEPNGSPSAPFATAEERTAWATANLATLLPGRTTVWGPGAVEYVWNGPLATDWREIAKVLWPVLPVPSRGLISAWGDSIISNSMFASWVEGLGLSQGGKWRIVYNGGIDTQTSSQIKARFVIGAGTYGESIVIIGAGTNNPGFSALADVSDMVDIAKTRGLTPIIALVGPKDTENTTAMVKYRHMLAYFCQKNSVLCVDPFGDYYHPDATGAWAAGAGRDATHPTSQTAFDAGIDVATQIDNGGGHSGLLSVLDLPVPLTDLYWARGNFVGSVGGLANAWSLSGPGVPSIADTDIGNRQVLTATALSADTYIYRGAPTLAQWAPGDKGLLVCRAVVSESSSARYFVTVVQGGANRTNFVEFRANGTYYVYLPFEIGSGLSNLEVQLKISGTANPHSGVLGIEQLNVLNLTKMGLE